MIFATIYILFSIFLLLDYAVFRFFSDFRTRRKNVPHTANVMNALNVIYSNFIHL